ncbi:MAG: DUF512 domain-containing protein [Lachnospiraceae bacterium]
MSDKHIIVGVEKHSIAHKLHIKSGDRLVKINGRGIADIFDYRFLIADEYLSIEIEKKNGRIKIFDIEKDYEEDLGMTFESSLMDDYKSCRNKCIFCFIDQMPPGMRETLYFKDDDSRLSFLQGNYITLTNMSEGDIDRIIDYHMEPVNISVHTTDAGLRCTMLNNRFAGEVLKYIDRLYDAGIMMNAQIVLCKGINDGEHLEKTVRDLMKYAPIMQSVSVVPVGLTKYRDGLTQLEPIEKNDATGVLRLIEDLQREAVEEFGLHFIHASDEFYILGQKPFPEEGRYDGYPQLENGVGMLRLLKDEFLNSLEAARNEKPDCLARRVSVATGVLAAPFLEELADAFTKSFGGEINIYPIKNDFFGESITVSGLICGCDLIRQLKGRDLGDELLIPVNMLRSGEEYFLDDITVAQAGETLNTDITVVPFSGECLFRAFAGKVNEKIGRQIYEQTHCCNCRQA